MPKSHRIWYRRIFPTAHKLLLNRKLDDLFSGVQGDVLVIGAGKEPYNKLLPSANSIVTTDIGPLHEGLDQVADAHDLPFGDESFDSVVAVEVFEHLQAPAVAAQEVYRVIRPGGTALITVPFMFHVHGDPHDFQRFTRNGIENLFKRFGDVSVTEFGSRVHVISDILTTWAAPFAALRISNFLLGVWPLNRESKDCPSGYIVELKK